MLKADALRHFKTLQALADAAEISVSAVSQWGDVVPEGSAYKLQVITGGAVRADPSLYKNRPKRGQTLHGNAA